MNDSDKKIKTRFAPSPTGYLHIGGLRTALYAYLFAKKNNGKFVLRIEDTDIERKVEGAEQVIFDTLKSAGLEYDEGPDVGGDFGPYIQSQRLDTYLPLAQKMCENGSAYYCFCTKERLDELHNSGHTKYDKSCLHSINLQEAKKRIAAGEKYVIRQNIPLDGVSTYTDMVFGKIEILNKELEDNILIKSDGYPTYNFANVVDDYLMGITHVIRGTEYLSSTPKYNLIYKGLGWQQPTYMHLQPIMKDATRKLSKRHGDASFADFINKGYLKEAIINYIALLGWSPKENREKFSLAELIEKFSVSGLSKAASVFDENKLKWLNAQYIKELPPEVFYTMALPYYKKAEYLKDYDLIYLSTLLQNRCEVLADVLSLTEFLADSINYKVDIEKYANEKLKTDINLAKKILPDLLKIAQNNFDTIHDSLVQYAVASSLKNGQVLWVFRIAITNSLNTPGGATEMAKLLGQQRVVKRLQASIL